MIVLHAKTCCANETAARILEDLKSDLPPQILACKLYNELSKRLNLLKLGGNINTTAARLVRSAMSFLAPTVNSEPGGTVDTWIILNDIQLYLATGHNDDEGCDNEC